MDGRRTDLDREPAGNDRGRDLDQAVGHDPAQGESPGGQCGHETEDETGGKGEQEPAQAGGEDRERGHEDEREHVVAEDRQSLLDRVAGVRRPDEAGQDRFHDAHRNHVG